VKGSSVEKAGADSGITMNVRCEDRKKVKLRGDIEGL
jgi:hypothetical protein